MAVSCEAKCGKSILLSFTLVHWLAGVSLVLLGASILVDPAKLHLVHFVTFDTLERDYGVYLAYGLLTNGVLIFAVSWSGCCGAIKENRCLLVLYFVLLSVLFLVEIAGSSTTLYFRGQWMKNLEPRLRQTLIDHYGNHSNFDKYLTFTDALNFAQYKFGCCGITDHTDYEFSQWRFKSRGFPEDKDAHLNNPKYLHLVPVTCCVLKPISEVEELWQSPNVANQTKCQLPKSDADYMLRHIRGCHQFIEEWMKQESAILITVGIGTAVLQMLGMILTICLCCNLGDDI